MKAGYVLTGKTPFFSLKALLWITVYKTEDRSSWLVTGTRLYGTSYCDPRPVSGPGVLMKLAVISHLK